MAENILTCAKAVFTNLIITFLLLGVWGSVWNNFKSTFFD